MRPRNWTIAQGSREAMRSRRTSAIRWAGDEREERRRLETLTIRLHYSKGQYRISPSEGLRVVAQW
jgi:hypothetical protein